MTILWCAVCRVFEYMPTETCRQCGNALTRLGEAPKRPATGENTVSIAEVVERY